MASIVFDTGPIISLALNNLLDILTPLRAQFGGAFLIPPSVKRELVDRPISSKKFKFEAIQVLRTIESGALQVSDANVHDAALALVDAANRIFRSGTQAIQIIQFAEMEALALAIQQQAAAMVVDERTTRLLVENPKLLHELLERKLDTRITLDRTALTEFQQRAAGVRFLRSAELAVMAYEHGMLDRYVLKIPEARKQLLQGMLWGLKLNGCGIPVQEIDTIVETELR